MRELMRRIAGPGQSSHVTHEVLKAIDKLYISPNRLLIRVGPPVDALQYDVTEPAPSLLVHMFTFTVFYGDDEETLNLSDLEYLAEEYRD